MLNQTNKNNIEDGFYEEKLISDKQTDEIVFDEENTDETAEEYNEEIYKWLSIAILLVWLASLIYL